MQNTNVPTNWHFIKLGEACAFSQGVQIDLEKQKAEPFFGGIPFLRIENYTQSSTDIRYIPESLSKNKVICEDDVVVVRYGATAGFVGKGLKGVLANNLFKVEPRADLLTKQFLFIKLKEPKAFRYFQNAMFGGAMPALSFSMVSPFKILLPPLEEQKKIAEILGTWDRAIEELTGLIAEKKELKRGLMQRLLTGTQRLPGFTQPWNNTKLGDIGIITSAGVDKKSIEGEKAVKLLNYMDVYKKDFLFASDVNMDVTASDRQIANCNLKRGDVFFTPSSETRDDIAHSAVVMEDVVNGVYSYHIIRLRPTIDIDMKYTAYAFKTGMFYKQAYALCEGSGQRYVLSQNYFRNMKIYIPFDSAEQKAIADVLSKADAEIDLLNQQLDLLKEQKRGLMQKLLTGEIRVKVDVE